MMESINDPYDLKAYKEGFKDAEAKYEKEKMELVGMLESINTIIWESGMIKGIETNVPAIMEILEKFSSKY